ncbi:hypothetical protein CHS0354_014481 [Potamilus streckersoni]|nr:hypothetical protein CHS0354_014481 [Potamilus streckersoni]
MTSKVVDIETGQPADSRSDRSDEEENRKDLLYSVDEVPPWYLCIILGFQHYLTAFGSTLTVPLVLYKHLCIDKDTVGLSELISTIFFVSGICTLLQTTLGCRLPIIQGGTFAFLTPTIAILSLPEWTCPFVEVEKGRNVTNLPEPGSEVHREMWQARLREIQGAIMVSSLFQVFIGFSGLIGIMLRFIGPLAITPTITLVGISLFQPAAEKAAKQWWIAVMTMFLIALFSQYLRKVNVPLCTVVKGCGFKRVDVPIFNLFPILMAMITAWVICAILTVAGAFPADSKAWGYDARTDTKVDVLFKSDWFRFPYPGQWGLPTVSVAGVFGMLAGVLSSMVESIGDYYACARLAGAPPPPVHAVNRGIGIEGIACVLAGAWGSGNGTTSYSENIGAIGITKVGSRRVVQTGALIMIILGCLGKFGALFVTIPEPVVGGMFMIMFGMITAVGLSNLQYIDLNSSRNIFILGTSLFFGLSFPQWMEAHDVVNTGSKIVDQIITVLLSTNMFVGGMIGFVLDNTIPGTDKERGIHSWRKLGESVSSDAKADMQVYDLPLIQKYLDSWTITRYLPFCPGFSWQKRKPTKENTSNGIEVNSIFDNTDNHHKVDSIVDNTDNHHNVDSKVEINDNPHNSTDDTSFYTITEKAADTNL